MKLYATVTSERASKGQGGEWLEIVISGSDKLEIARLFISEGDIMFDYDEDATEFRRERGLKPKGEKQKGEGKRPGDEEYSAWAES